MKIIKERLEATKNPKFVHKIFFIKGAQDFYCKLAKNYGLYCNVNFRRLIHLKNIFVNNIKNYIKSKQFFSI